MSVEESITVRITAQGVITAETHGIIGPKCMDYIATLEDLLEATTQSSSFTGDYHATTTTQPSEVSHELRQQS